MADDKKNEDFKEDDFSTDEFDEIYNDDDMELVDVDNIDVSDVEETVDSDLDFIEEDIEEVLSDETTLSDVPDIGLSDDEPVMGDDLDAQPAKKKKSSLGTLLIALIVIGGGGAGAYFSGMIPGFGPQSSSYTVPMPADDAPVDNGMTANEDIFAEDQPQQQPQDTNQSDIEDLYAESFNDGDEQAEEPAVQEITEETNLGFLNSEEETNSEDLFDETEAEEAQDPFVGNEDIAEEELPLSEETIEEMPEPVIMSSSDTSQLVNVEDDIANLKSQLNALQGNLNSRLSDLESKLNNLPETSSNNQAAPVDLSGLESAIDKLSDRLDSMEDQIASVKGSAASIPAVAKKAQPKAAAPTPVTTPAPAKAEAAQVSYKWEIRAIQVGKAVIARKGETRNIVVGDNVPGLGTIKDINYKNGGWVIEGSSSSVKQ